MELIDVSIEGIVALATQKQNKMAFSTEDFVLIKVLRQGKGYDNWSHCFIGDNWERGWVCVVTETSVLNE